MATLLTEHPYKTTDGHTAGHSASCAQAYGLSPLGEQAQIRRVVGTAIVIAVRAEIVGAAARGRLGKQSCWGS